MDTCLYCESNLVDYDPVYVEETTAEGRQHVGGFCNYACLSEWIEDEDKLTGACCTIDI